MSVNVNLLQIQALKEAVERVVGEPLETHNAFLHLVDSIEGAQREHISESTLERLWGYSTRKCDAVSIRTLNVLSRYVGTPSWKSFCEEYLKSAARESEEIFVGESIDTARLAPGRVLKLGWMPDRLIEVRHIGESRFEVLSSENSSIRPGDRFTCLHIRKGRELYLDNYVRKDSSAPSCYVVGQNHGICIAEVE